MGLKLGKRWQKDGDGNLGALVRVQVVLQGLFGLDGLAADVAHKLFLVAVRRLDVRRQVSLSREAFAADLARERQPLAVGQVRSRQVRLEVRRLRKRNSSVAYVAPTRPTERQTILNFLWQTWQVCGRLSEWVARWASSLERSWKTRSQTGQRYSDKCAVRWRLYVCTDLMTLPHSWHG